MNGKVAKFGIYDFDFAEMVLRENGNPVPLQPQPTQVLAILLEEPGRLVTRDELTTRVWRDRIVEFDAGLNFSINQVRRALGDTASKPAYLVTIHRRGYRFIAPVEFEARRRPTLESAARSGRSGAVLVAATVAAIALAITGGAWSQAETTDLASLPQDIQITYRAAQWLYEQGEPVRALARLDSVRIAQPEFANAWTLTAHARRAADDFSGARSAAQRAIELDRGLADAHYALGLAEFFESQGRDALREFEQAVRLAPQSVKYRQWYAQALANQLRLGEAIDQLEEARRIDPISNMIGSDLAMVYIAADRFDEAVEYCTNSLELVDDAESWARDCLLTAHHFRGERAISTRHARDLMELLGATPDEMSRVTVLQDYFRWDLARIERLETAGEALSPFDRVRANARLQDRDATLDGLRSLREDRHLSLQWSPRDTWFRFLHADPEFQAILREAGLPVPETT